MAIAALKNLSLRKALFIIMAVEAVIMGSGQLIHVLGPLTLKMAIFGFAMLYLLIYYAKYPRIDKYVAPILLYFVFCLSVAISVGVINGSSLAMIFEDVKPLLFIFILPFFVISINNEQMVNSVIEIIKWGALFMSVAYIIYLLFISRYNVLSFTEVYNSAADSGQSDFLFRGESGALFYKGFIYLPIGLVFWLNTDIALLKKIIISSLIVIAIFFTYTRGFYIITALGVMLFYLKRNRKVFYLLAISSLLTVFFFLLRFDFSTILSDRSESNSIRVITIKQVFGSINPVSLLIGHGFGNGVEIRPGHMEMSYLEVLHKQGLLGLSFWLYLYVSLTSKYHIVAHYCGRKMLPFYVGIVMIYFQSLFNPFLNNPIGLSFIMMAFGSIMYYYKNRIKWKDRGYL